MLLPFPSITGPFCDCSPAQRAGKHRVVRGKDAKRGWVPLSRLGCAAGTVHRRHPATDRHGSFDLLRLRPGPVHPSLGDLVSPSSPGPTISMPASARTPARHSSLQPRTPGLKPSASLSLPGAWITGTSHRARLPAAPAASALQRSGTGSSSLAVAAGCINASATQWEHGGAKFSSSSEDSAQHLTLERPS